jgi:hypothetical protein
MLVLLIVFRFFFCFCRMKPSGNVFSYSLAQNEQAAVLGMSRLKQAIDERSASNIME